MNNKMLFFACLIAAVLMAGCDCGDEGAAVVSSSDSKVLASVNGYKYTESDFRNEIDFRVGYFKYMATKSRGIDIARVKQKATEDLIPMFLRRSIIDSFYAKLAATNANLSSVEQVVRGRHEQVYIKSKPGTKSFVEIEKEMDKLGIGKCFKTVFDSEVKTAVLVDCVYSNLFFLGERELKAVRNHIAAANKFSAITNAAIDATISNVLAEIKKGTDFSRLVEKYDMAPPEFKESSDYEWTESDFKDIPGLWEKLGTMDKGDTTGVIDAVDSWHIYRIDDVISPDRSQAGEMAYKLSRIYFRRADQVGEYTDAELREMLESNRKKNVMRYILAKEIPNLKITFPSPSDKYYSKSLEELDKFIQQVRKDLK